MFLISSSYCLSTGIRKLVIPLLDDSLLVSDQTRLLLSVLPGLTGIVLVSVLFFPGEWGGENESAGNSYIHYYVSKLNSDPESDENRPRQSIPR